MKKYLFIMILGALTLTITHAQVVTGGVSADDESIDSGMKAIVQMESHLIEQDKICSPQKNSLKKKDIMDIYLKLSLMKGVKNPAEECAQIKKYLACMNSEETKRLAGILYGNKTAPTHLAAIHNIDEKEARKVIKFFSYLED